MGLSPTQDDDPYVLTGTMLVYDLHEWVVNHIQKTDKKLGDLLRNCA